MSSKKSSKKNSPQKKIHNIKKEWNNERYQDYGIEKTVRLFLTIFQYFTVNMYLRIFFSTKKERHQNYVIDFYILSKTFFPLIILGTGLYNNHFFIFLAAYFSLETIFYIMTLIFVGHLFAKNRSYKRVVILLFFNYIEIVLNFAVLYGGLNCLGQKAHSVIDYIYFSFITATAIGFGDIIPITSLGKVFVCIQSIFFLMFVVIFLSYFGSKIEHRKN